MAESKYKWSFYSLGGVTRVNIRSGQDIANLGQLDKKLWTVLSCPVKGLEFSAKTLELLDTDKDGKIKTKEIVAAAEYVTGALKNPDVLLKSKDSIALSEFNTDSIAGKKLQESANTILSFLGINPTEISQSNIEAYVAAVNAETPQKAGTDTVVKPYGDNTDAVIAAYNALNSKVQDYFMRCKLLAYNGDCSSVIDSSVASIGSISAGDLSVKMAEIAAMPLAKPQTSVALPAVDNVNPAWKDTYKTVANLALAVDFPDLGSCGEIQWQQVGTKIGEYAAALEALSNGEKNSFFTERDGKLAMASELDHFICLYKDLYVLIKNYVVFSDFYSRDDEHLAIFQAGQLFIDQRCCDLCVRVEDMGQHADMAKLSGMFLIYCNCVSFTGTETMNIVAVLTEGDVNGLRAGKHALFIDRQGKDWYATVTSVVDNPVSIRQAFWSPYRKFGRWCSEKINKMASDRENKVSGDMTNIAQAKIDGEAKTNKQQAFDIAKFAGIFAAIGLALGAIGSFLSGILDKCLILPWWKLAIIVVVIMLLISGPSMFIAWGKLRKRDLGPVLNANGWAINSRVLVNVHFGHTLTSLAKYPKLDLRKISAADPYAKNKSSFWPWFFAILIVLAIAAAVMLLSDSCTWLDFLKR